jgi:ATP-binding cassette, subfamily B, bacterial MsbA
LKGFIVLNLKTTLQSPAYRLVFDVALRNWSLLAINLITNLLGAILEGSTLGVIYLALSLLSEQSPSQANTSAVIKLLSIMPMTVGQLFLVLLGLAVLLQSFLSLSNYINKLSASYLSARAQPQVTGTIFKQIMSLSFACASHYKVGDLIKFANDAPFTVNEQILKFNDLAVSLSFAMLYAIVLLKLSPWLALVAIAIAALIVLVQWQIIPKLRLNARTLNLVQVEAAKLMTENIQALRLIHTSGTQKRAINEINLQLEKIQTHLQRRAKLFYLPEPILDIMPILAMALLAASAYKLSTTPANILPMLLTFLLVLQRLAIRLKAIANVVTRLADSSANMQRLDVILDRSDKQFAYLEGLPFAHLETDIVFEQVSLSYGIHQPLVLRNLSFTIAKHKVTAFVGSSGAGKSSIVDLLLGLYQPNSGRILVNGQNLQTYDPSAWRQHIGVVSQDTFVFNCSILDNLCYGSAGIAFEQVIEATKAAQAHQFILELPNGYHTIVGERGYRLSGGQRQRLALARALIKQPDILVLDEATSALDSESEQLIQKALEQLQHRHTVIVIAHRLSTIAKADQILVLEQGKLVEQGSHYGLMKQKSRYAHYWNLQMQGVSA